jgi:rhamnose utilization protein RhaD (predicted bifunctional aldolase and dehydrogenase)/NAD(P)-dependent dehydrogenase (short-subunit alcohol dehydrogenase family)
MTTSPHDFPQLQAELVAISRHFGSDPSLVLAGGGNSSVKTADRLLVKASGGALATIGADGFVEMDREKLDELAHADLGSDPQAREAAFKEAILAARRHPESNLRPSVECLLHHLLPGRFVFHSHATLGNALTCCTKGEELARELFGDEVLWLPYVDPGFTLAQALRQALGAWRERTGRESPPVLLMANHGMIVQGEDADEMKRHTDRVLAKIAVRLATVDAASGAVERRDDARALIEFFAPTLRGLLAEGDEALKSLKVVNFDDSERTLRFVGSADGRAIVANGPLTPDQIVYCDSFPLWFELGEDEEPDARLERLRAAIDEHREQHGIAPKVVLVAGLGLFAAGDDLRSAVTVGRLYLDAIAVMEGASRLGEIRPLDEGHRRFIEEWEVEDYRRKIAAAARGGGRAHGRIAVVTGAAQGFGREIAVALIAEGGHVALTDRQGDEVKEVAAGLAREHGEGRALGLSIDVTDRDSIAAAFHEVVRCFGGFDLVVSNAGVLRAESVKTQRPEDFRLVTDVNYLGYFLCTQVAAPILARQHDARPGYRSDIIQINSKSGLVGSNRNAAYAGSKFGGLGLTQSFALELITDGIKVNAICPGNFFDGPLWSDPEDGLFMQYLRAGKVKGARSVEEIRRAYEAKVPMGRGCETADVMRALFYLVEQHYETGQALPVTGGQVMLS